MPYNISLILMNNWGGRIFDGEGEYKFCLYNLNNNNETTNISSTGIKGYRIPR
jgi:hypothetical protein